MFPGKKFVVHFDILHIIKYDFYERHIINLHIGPVCISASWFERMSYYNIGHCGLNEQDERFCDMYVFFWTYDLKDFLFTR